MSAFTMIAAPEHVTTVAPTRMVQRSTPSLVAPKPANTGRGDGSGSFAAAAVGAAVAAVAARRSTRVARKATGNRNYSSRAPSSIPRVWTDKGVEKFAQHCEGICEIGAVVTEEQVDKIGTWEFVAGGDKKLGTMGGRKSNDDIIRDMLQAGEAVSQDPSPIVHVTSAFDSGNGDLQGVPTEISDGVWWVVICLRPEPFTDGTDNRSHMQWFHFRASNVAGSTLRVSIPNAGDASFPEAWKDYRPAASYDRKNWFRCNYATYEGGELRWEHRMPPQTDTVWFAYFAPYSSENHRQLISRCSTSPLARLSVPGSTLDGNPLDIVTVGKGPASIWILARQHPAETMAEWAVEGLLDRLLNTDDALARQLRSRATIYVVPNMNPDGAVRGYSRVNACGANLNCEWATIPDTGYTAPTLHRSPEVFHVLQEMDRVGCDCFIDIRGDEIIEANFFVTNGRTPRIEDLEERLGSALQRANPDFQMQLGYAQMTPNSERNEAYKQEMLKRPNVGTTQVGERYDCLSVTLEMPFQDAKYPNPMPANQWSPARSQKLGASLVGAISDVLPNLRAGRPAMP